MAGNETNVSWRDLFSGKPPSTDQVIKFHEKADKDASPKAIHHTLGPGPNQAASGDHSHDGGNSAQLLSNIVFTGSRTTIANIVPQLIAALVQLGATDNTTP
jgi:hypothetical protein